MNDLLPPSRRDRKKQATRTAIHESALRLVEERGLAGITVEDITERADVAPRTFFNYFSSKEDAVIGRPPGLLDELVSALRSRPADEPVFDSLCQVMIDNFVSNEVDPAALLRTFRVVKSDPLLLGRMAAQTGRLEHGLIAEVAARTGRNPARDLEPALLVTVTLAACRTALMHWSDQGGRRPVAAAVAEALDRLATGVSHLSTPAAGATQ